MIKIIFDVAKRMAGRNKKTIRKLSEECRVAMVEMLIVSNPYSDLEQQVNTMGARGFSSFAKAKTACEVALKSFKDKPLRAKAFKAFELCYADIEMYEKAAEMKKKYNQLCEEHNLDLP